MDVGKFKYTAKFDAIAHVFAPSDEDVRIAKASLEPLRNLLPVGVDPEDSPDLLYYASNGAVAGLCNRNGDSVSNGTALAIHKTCVNKPVSVEHNRDHVIGVILYPGLSRFGSNEPVTEEQAAVLKEPFNMSFAGVLWKVVNPMVSKYITQQAGSSSNDSLSMSWEIAFSDFDIGVGGPNLFDAKVVSASDPIFGAYEKLLRQNGGKGQDASGKELFRIIKGDAIILGYSVVSSPAAHVRGILPIEKAIIPALIPAPVNTVESASSQKSEKSYITPSNVSVTINTVKPMKIENLEQIESQWAEIRQLESSAAVVDFVKAIQTASEQFAKDAKAKEDLVKNAELAKAENEKRAQELQASLDSVKKELGEVRAAQEAAVANQKFQDRMTSFDEQFDLDDEDRKIIASDIKELDDAAFETYAKKCEKLMAAKKKGAKSKATDDKDEDDKKDQSKDNFDAKAAVASVKEDASQTKLPNTVVVSEDLKQQIKAAFEGSVKLDGKTLAERRASKTKK